jgi:hypothetical protein
VSIKMDVFWVVAPCRLVWVYQRELIVLMMEAVKTPETLINSYKSKRRYIPEDSHLQGNLNSLNGSVYGRKIIRPSLITFVCHKYELPGPWKKTGRNDQFTKIEHYWKFWSCFGILNH